jgi:hypothetical protein
MFGTGHPRPLHRKEVAMHVLRQEARRLDSHTLTVDVPDAPLPPAAQAIRFDVVYTLSEYLGFLREHLAFVLRRTPPATRLRWTAVPLACAVAASAGAWFAGPGGWRMLLAACAAFALACLPIAAGAWVPLIGTPVFLVKKRRMPQCAFCIDARGIERRTRAGTLVRGWADVRRVRRYRQGYLLIFDRGALPIPFRCLDRAQEAAFRRLAARAGAA